MPTRAHAAIRATLRPHADRPGLPPPALLVSRACQPCFMLERPWAPFPSEVSPRSPPQDPLEPRCPPCRSPPHGVAAPRISACKRTRSPTPALFTPSPGRSSPGRFPPSRMPSGLALALLRGLLSWASIVDPSFRPSQRALFRVSEIRKLARCDPSYPPWGSCRRTPSRRRSCRRLPVDATDVATQKGPKWFPTPGLQVAPSSARTTGVRRK
jgi:hypothetical protein